MATKYNVHGFPTILFINEAGKVESMMSGYQTAAPFADRLNLIAAAHHGVSPLQTRVKTYPDDMKATGKLAAVLALQDKIADSEALVAQAEKTDPDNAQDQLTLAYNLLGDYYQDKNDLDKAVSYFARAAKSARNPSSNAYARLSLAQCYMAQKKNADALNELKTADALPDLPRDDKDMVEMFLKPLQKQTPNQ